MLSYENYLKKNCNFSVLEWKFLHSREISCAIYWRITAGFYAQTGI